uniref:Salivary protein n=1 Tax=Ixodes persulcatus TaxID=34615 RepID=I4IY12_IXOPE|nr:salp15 Ipers-2 [Ixodes persulcatus]CCI50996.1 salivary protein [Ixodes persulcatus]
MKVVCIIVFFVIVAEPSSAIDLVKTNGEPGSQKKLPLKFPQFILKPKELALKLLTLCNEYSTKHPKSMRNERTASNTAINDKEVDFKNCTFYCKYNIHNGEYDNVTLPMPPDTPCGPQNQTCADKSKCVGHIPGC